MTRSSSRALALLLAALLTLGLAPMASAQTEPTAGDVVLIGLTDNDELTAFAPEAPDEAPEPVAVEGLDVEEGETILAADTRPATGQLLGVTSLGRVFAATFDASAPAAVRVQWLADDPLDTELTAPVSLDVNPSTDRVRVLDAEGQNLRVNPNTGRRDATHEPLRDEDGEATPAVVAAAHSGSSAAIEGDPEATTLYAVDRASDALATIDPASEGVVRPVGALGLDAESGTPMGFDVATTVEGEDDEPALVDRAYLSVVAAGAGVSTIHPVDLGDAALGEGVTANYAFTDIAAVITDAPGDRGEALYGLAGDGTRLVRFGAESSPRITHSVPLGGLASDEVVRAIDLRPENGRLVALTSADALVEVRPDTGAVRRLESEDPGRTIQGEQVTIDVDPVRDVVRIVSDEGDNLRADPDEGGVTSVDDPLAFAEDDPSAGAEPGVVGVTHRNSRPSAQSTRLHGVDLATGALVRQAPNAGTLTTIAPLTVGAEDAAEPVALQARVGFDQSSRTGNAYLSAALTDPENPDRFAPALWTVDLATGELTPLAGTNAEGVPFGLGVAVSDVAVARQTTTSVTRLSGDGRLGTAVAVSEATFEPATTEVVYVASADDYPDAVAAGPAAFTEDAPILLTGTTFLPEETADEIARLAPARIVVLGGRMAVDDGVVAELAAVSGAEISRLSGETRFETAAAISAARFDTEVRTVFIATGLFFSDALTGGALASREPTGPVLLVHERIPAAAEEELRRLGPERIVVFGGTEAVSDRVLDDLAGFTDGEVVRLSEPGGTRFDTAAAILEDFPDDVDRVFVATGEDFPDALATVPSAAQDATGIALSGREEVQDSVTEQITRLDPDEIVVVGGEGVLSPAVARDLEALLDPRR